MEPCGICHEESEEKMCTLEFCGKRKVHARCAGPQRIRKEAYFIAEKSGFTKTQDECWYEAEKKLNFRLAPPLLPPQFLTFDELFSVINAALQ